MKSTSKASSSKGATNNAESTTAPSSKSNSAAQDKLKSKGAAIYGYYDGAEAGQKLADSIDESGLPKGTDVYMGTYGINQTGADIAHSIEGGKYAPLISAVRGDSKSEQAMYAARDEGVEGDKAHAGAIPTLEELVQDKKDGKIKNVQYHAYHWGLEAGRRWRDNIKEKQEKGIDVDSWQFDEIWPSASNEDKETNGVTAGMKREYLRGFIEGMAKGRDGDPVMKGIVHIAHMNALTQLGNAGEMKKFWKTLDECTSYIVGEEYPGFGGGTKGAQSKAAQADKAVDRLDGFGSTGKSLKKKYVAGMTPGFRGTDQYETLGGRQKGQSTGTANNWRDAYIAARAEDGVAGFGEYNWLGNNVAQRGDVTKDVAEGVAKV